MVCYICTILFCICLMGLVCATCRVVFDVVTEFYGDKYGLLYSGLVACTALLRLILIFFGI